LVATRIHSNILDNLEGRDLEALCGEKVDFSLMCKEKLGLDHQIERRNRAEIHELQRKFKGGVSKNS
jgi:hypothetical protein